MYNGDALVTAGAEKLLEPVMYHFDAARREALGSASCTLRQLFPGAVFANAPGLANVVVACRRSPITFVDSFCSLDCVVDCLLEGSIVVSRFHGEVGAEYLVPWTVNGAFPRVLDAMRPPEVELSAARRRTDGQRDLLVLMVQVKSVKGKVDWSAMDNKLKDLSKRLWRHPRVRAAVRLYYTTHDQDVDPTRRLPAIIFTRQTLGQLMLPLVGMLRFMMEKPGQRHALLPCGP
jgi:hypothetical protein